MIIYNDQNTGLRLKEGAAINRSLLALGNCINALAEKKTKYVMIIIIIIMIIIYHHHHDHYHRDQHHHDHHHYADTMI